MNRCPPSIARRLCRWLLLLAAVVAPSVPAHEFSLDAVMIAFVKVEPTQARLVVRVPLYLFKSVKFPVGGAEIEVDNAGPAIERSLKAIEHDIVLTENGRPLVASGASGIKPGVEATIDHVCYTVPNWDEARVRATLKAKGLDVSGRDGSLHVYDPFNYDVQLASAAEENAFKR